VPAVAAAPVPAHHDVRRVSFLSRLLLVVLRVAIGWHLFYEGAWKIHTQATAEPWTARGYLITAQGPLREKFRELVEDPYEFDKLDFQKMHDRWTAWAGKFAEHYQLNDEQKTALDKLLEEYVGQPAGSKERDRRKAAKKATLRSLLETNPDWLGSVNEEQAGTVDHKRIGEIELYKGLVVRYESQLKNVRLDFDRDHLDKVYADLVAARAALIGPIDALTDELRWTAEKLLTVEQHQRGPIPPEMNRLRQVDLLTMWGLAVLGLCLIAGFFTRLSAFLSAGLVLLFYLAQPPLPGIPPPPGPEHALYVNKNMIEVLALLAIASLPTGRWFGVDALVRRLLFRAKSD